MDSNSRAYLPARTWPTGTTGVTDTPGSVDPSAIAIFGGRVVTPRAAFWSTPFTNGGDKQLVKNETGGESLHAETNQGTQELHAQSGGASEEEPPTLSQMMTQDSSDEESTLHELDTETETDTEDEEIKHRNHLGLVRSYTSKDPEA